MAYKALYRTYRPQIFDEVVGQKYVLQTLKNAIKEEHIAHAYLFSGPRGTGKTTIAKLLAKGINCTSNKEKPCGECPNCVAIARGNHPDVVEIDAASNNGVDEVRELVDKVKYTPVQGKFKVYIIDEVHMMSAGAFNALLKTLEEPPAHVVFILATTEVHKVLPTIISRCQRFDFGRVSSHDIQKRITAVLQHEKLRYDPEVVPFIASLADGGVRDALGILDQALAYTNDQLSLQDIRDIFGIATNEEMLDFILSIEQGKVDECLQKIDEFDRKGIDLIRLTSMLIDIYKSIVIYHKAKSSVLIHNLSQENLLVLVDRISQQQAFAAIDILIEALTNYKKINTPKAFFELAVLKMCNRNEVKEAVIEPATIKVTTPMEKKVVVNEVATQEVKATPVVEAPQPKVEPKVESTPLVKQVIETPTTSTKEEAPTPAKVEAAAPIKEDNHDGEYVYSEEDLINILVQGNKADKNSLMEKWSIIKQYQLKPAFAKAAALIIDGSPFAVANDAIIFAFKDKPQANQLNDYYNHELARRLIYEIIEREVYCYGMSEEESRRLRTRFIQLSSMKELPEARKIEAPKFVQRTRANTEIISQPQVNEKLALGKSLFGDLLEVKGEK